MLEALFGIIGEFLLQIVLEVLIELGLYSVAEPFRRRPSPWMATFGYLIFGAIFGGLSLLIFPNYLVSYPGLRIANLLITPVIVGLCMTTIGLLRTKRGQAAIRIDRFGYGFCFAFSFALVRYFFAN